MRQQPASRHRVLVVPQNDRGVAGSLENRHEAFNPVTRKSAAEEDLFVERIEEPGRRDPDG